MQEITHCHNQRPIYETSDKELLQWDQPSETFEESRSLSNTIYHPFVFDIETSAELGQRPILLVGLNTLESRLVVLYKHGFQGYDLTREKVLDMVEDFDLEFEKLTVQNLSISNFERHILRPISRWNRKAKERGDKHRISLVAHNAQFDIPMMGTPNDGLLNNSRIGDQYEQAVRYKEIHMVGHRAGQFGQIYTFLDSANGFENLHIPVGDTLVAAQALWLPGKLKYACEKMNLNIDVTEAEVHGNLNDKYVEYCINDTVATFELYKSLYFRINEMFGNLPIEHIYSTASIGKYVLRKMNYGRVGYSQEAVDRIAPAYFGGRTDAEVTGEIVENLRYTDILSQYPTVSALTDVWDYMKAQTVDIEQIPVSDLPEVGDLTDKDSWPEIRDYYVKVKPEGATLPVRTPHLGDTTKVVTSQVHSDTGIQYHYMDLIAAQLIDGEKKYEIVSAWQVTKEGSQDLEATEVAGVTINPEDNVMAKCIESRKSIQFNNKEQGIGNKSGKDETTKSLKITANSEYGISAERVVKELDGEKHDYASNTGFYNPHVATTITAGGRLMLALGEKVAKDNGGELVYCDTDSLIVSDNVVDEVIGAFNNLNPYDGKAGELDVLEDEKEQVGKLYAVGTKKYIFFDSEGETLEYKEHGLGNYENLRGKDSDGYDIVKRLWATIMYYDIGENPLNVPVLYDGKLNELLLWSFNASTVQMRQMVDKFTEEYIRYGDWLQSTLSYDNSVRYIALNLEEKEDDDKVVKVTTDNEEVVGIEQVTKADMKIDGSLKSVRDVVNKFTQDAATLDERPTVKVTDKKIVTKEATNRMDIFEVKLEQEFKKNMGYAADMLISGA